MAEDQDTEKSHEPTQRKLDEQRKKGQITKSADVSTAAAYAGLFLVLAFAGTEQVRSLGQGLMVFLDQPGQLREIVFSGSPSSALGGAMVTVVAATAGWFLAPAAAVILSLFAQRAIVFAPSKLAFKGSRINPVQNAKNKFGRSGLFEFFKSFAKLLIFSLSLALFLNARLELMIGALRAGSFQVAGLLGRLCLEFLGIVVVIASLIAVVDYMWQRSDFLRRNRMSRKEVTDESKESEGDPQMKQQRRQKAQQIALSQMMAKVPDADVVIVNPTHFAVALKWSWESGSAPICVAKGVDNVARKIREVAQESAVPVHSDPPTARALHATVEVGQEIAPEHYKAVAVAIRFAEKMRQRARR